MQNDKVNEFIHSFSSIYSKVIPILRKYSYEGIRGAFSWPALRSVPIPAKKLHDPLDYAHSRHRVRCYTSTVTLSHSTELWAEEIAAVIGSVSFRKRRTWINKTQAFKAQWREVADSLLLLQASSDPLFLSSIFRKNTGIDRAGRATKTMGRKV